MSRYGSGGQGAPAKDPEPLRRKKLRRYITAKEAADLLPDGDAITRELLREAADTIEMLSKKAKQREWILCSKRMPEEHEWMGTKKFGTTISDEVYVTLENSEGRRYTQHLSFQNGKLSTADQSRLDAIFKGGTPIAWMPLPEPYKEGSEK